MAKRGYKLQEFVAHASNVNCLNIGKKSSRFLVTGGEDHKVNLWSIGKSTSLLSLSGHTSSVESVTFDSSEVLVVSGASTGAIKLWDLEEAKIVRTLTGHRLNCTAVEFHPFGEFFASGSSDTNLKIWDVRKKGCIHTYKGHTQGVSTIRFTPDGRWVVSGGDDSAVKVWDLTAGKLLHEFKFHEGQIRCIDFHPLEFLLATGSADRTVKFWDLETFELIGSAGPEETGVRSMTFHPDGRTLFCGLDASLKVLSWEPIICHDAVEMGWSTLGDLHIHEGKLLACSFYRNCVGVWVADTSLIGPYGVGISPQSTGQVEQKFNLRESHSVEKLGCGVKSNTRSPTIPQDNETTEIRNIYVDTSASKKITPRRVGSISAPKVVLPSDSSEISNPSPPKKSPEIEVNSTAKGEVIKKHFTVPVIVPRNNPNTENAVNSRRESITTEKISPAVLLKPTHVRRPSNGKYETEKLSVSAESGSFGRKTSGLDSTIDPKFNFRLLKKDEATETSEDNNTNIRNVAEKLERVLSPNVPLSPSHENCDEPQRNSAGINSSKRVNGAVQPGRTRSLVERWEKREKINTNEALIVSPSTDVIPETPTPPHVSVDEQKGQPQTPERVSTSVRDDDEAAIEDLMKNHEIISSSLRSRLTKLQVVRHFWKRNDIKGGINAVGKLPDHFVQADVVSVLMEKMDIFTLDLFSCLLPVATGLLNSAIDRHTSVSLDVLLKLVAIFGPVIQTTMSATPSVGVDLHMEKRRECCNQCFAHLQKIKLVLPSVIRRGGLLAKCAQELNLVLQES